MEALEDRTLLSAAGPEMQTTAIPQPIIAALEQQAVRVMATEQSEFNGMVQIATTAAFEFSRGTFGSQTAIIQKFS